MTVIVTGVIAGSLDLAAALLLFILRSKQKPSVLLRYIASAAFGRSAFDDGNTMVFLGVGFHYIIAMSWTVIYFLVFPTLFPCNTSVFTNATVYGMFVWIIMNLVILPISKAVPRPFSPWIALINIMILIIAIGLPCAYVAKQI